MKKTQNETDQTYIAFLVFAMMFAIWGKYYEENWLYGASIAMIGIAILRKKLNKILEVKGLRRK